MNGFKTVVARKLLEKYLEHQRESMNAHHQNKFLKAVVDQQLKLRDVYAKLWKDFDFDKEFGLIWHPATQQNFK